ncbi:MAG: rod shape-determining protein MreC [Butyrivibrio sp.]|nr:rod shape-determining protein MreC [Butyrivibrio sp.]
MSPVIRRNGEEFTIPSKYLLSILTALCVVLMLITFNADKIDAGPLTGPINTFASIFMTPLQRGITTVGTKIKNTTDRLAEISRLLDENEKLKTKVDELTIENTRLQREKYDYIELKKLYEIDSSYENYKMVGATVIAKSQGKWYDSFTIDKGEDNGLKIDMNVLADGGLVGRIIEIGPDFAVVQTIISDDNNVTGTVMSLQKNLNVSGNLKEYDSGNISFSRLKADNVKMGDIVVTSKISEKYVPDILIGSISGIENEPDNTKRGTITPAVDFEHLNRVLVIVDPEPYKKK